MNGPKNLGRSLRFHDYADLYKRPGLYEQLYTERLKCASPEKVVQLLSNSIRNAGESFSHLRVLDVGAGNGMVGECLAEQGVSRLIGVDILPEAKEAAERDRPGLYDAYYVTDLTYLPHGLLNELEAWQADAITVVAALGFGDIPPKAFSQAFNLIQVNGWVAFNIKETFFSDSDQSGFSQLIRRMINHNYLFIHHIERYQHRVSIDGMPLYYYAIVGKKIKSLF
jgi:predicted TPR repeat methyltransferase